MKRVLLVGCGNSRVKAFWFDGSDEVGVGSPEKDFDGQDVVTLDIDADLGADVVHDLNELPYPFDDSEFDEIHAYEVLEHCGRQGDGKFFFGQFKEFWRILKPGGYMFISVPTWSSVSAWAVPDHCRVLPAEIFSFLSREYEEAHKGAPGLGDYRKARGAMHFDMLTAKEGEAKTFVLLRRGNDELR